MKPQKKKIALFAGSKFKEFLTNWKYKEVFVFAAVFIFSFSIRWMAVDHGFPLLTHPDEPAIMDPIFHMSMNRTLNPGVFYRPDQILYLLNFFFLNVLSILKFGQNYAATFISNKLFFYYYARLLISVFGALIPIIAYKIGKEIKPSLALPSALVFALFPAFVKHSLYVTPDIPITFFSLLIILLTLLYLNRNDEKFMYAAVIFSAFNTAEKYPGLISLSIILLGMVINFLEDSRLSFRKDWFRFLCQGVKYIAIYISTLIITTPYLFIEHTKVLNSLIGAATPVHLGADGLGWGGNLLFYIRNFISWTNLFAVLFIGVGVFALIKWQNKKTLFLMYGALYWILLSKLSLHWERWGLPMYITPLFLIAIGIAYAWQRTKKLPKVKYMSIILISGFFFYQFIYTIHIPIRMSFIDTRLIALEYCREQGITNKNTYYEGYSPLFPQKPLTIFNEDISQSDSINYVILSSYMFDRFYAEAVRFEKQVAFYDSVRMEQQLIAQFVPEPSPSNLIDRVDDIVFHIKILINSSDVERYKGPVIEIYQIGN